MKANNVHNLVTSSEISDVTGLSRTNFNDNYLRNKTRDKSKIVKTLAFGTYMLLENITEEEMILARELILAKRVADETIKDLDA